MTEDNNKVTIILAIGLIGIALSLLYILNNYIKTQQPLSLHNKFNGLNNLSAQTNQKHNNNELWNVIRNDNGDLNIEVVNKDNINI